jgi:hypothetical protein
VSDLRESFKSYFEPLPQRLKQRPSSLVANFSAPMGRPTAYLFLDPVQGGDSLKGLTCCRRSVCLLQIIKLAPNVGPAGDFLNAAILFIFIELVESGISVSLQRSSELAKMALRMFSLAIW